MTCKNCGQSAEESFCQFCGQKTSVRKLDFRSVLGELSDTIFQVDRGFFYTIKELFVRPGNSIREYLNGQRKDHFKPIAYAFTLSTIYFLLSQYVDSQTFINDAIAGWSTGVEEAEDTVKHIRVLNWFAENYSYTILALLPLFSFASFLSFRKSGFNYFEHFVLNAYITGQQAVLYIVFSSFNFVIVNDDLLTSVTLVVSISYNLLVYWQFFVRQSRVSVVLRSILTYVLYLLLVAIAFVAVLLITK